jgi:hypothetical protein
LVATIVWTAKGVPPWIAFATLAVAASAVLADGVVREGLRIAFRTGSRPPGDTGRDSVA